MNLRMWKAFRKPLMTLLTLSAVHQFSAITPAVACGGFFCNANQPVNQNAESLVGFCLYQKMSPQNYQVRHFL